MPGAATVLSVGVGICCCHSSPTCRPMVGIIITGSGAKSINNIGAARVTDLFLGACGHPSIMVTGSPNEASDSLSESRITDMFVGCVVGIIVSGSGDVTING